MYAFPAKVLKKLSVNSFIPYYDFISNCVTNVFEKTYDVAIDFYGYGSFVTAFLATKIQAKTSKGNDEMEGPGQAADRWAVSDDD